MTAMTCSCAVLMVLSASTPARGQSLVDVAKQEAERRSAVERPARIYSNADLRPVFDAAPVIAAPRPAPAMPESARAANPEASAIPAAPVHADHPESAAVRKARAERHTRDGDWRAQQPIVIVNPYPSIPWIVHPMGVTTGTNTPREQAMADYMRAAGFAPPMPATGSR